MSIQDQLRERRLEKLKALQQLDSAKTINDLRESTGLQKIQYTEDN